MRAAWYERQGPAREVLKVGVMADPIPGSGEVRIRIAASGINPGTSRSGRTRSDTGCRILFTNVRVDFLGSDDFTAADKAEAAVAVNEALTAGWVGMPIAERSRSKRSPRRRSKPPADASV